MINIILSVLLIILQVAGLISLIAVITFFVLLKRGYEFNAKFYRDDEEENNKDSES